MNSTKSHGAIRMRTAILASLYFLFSVGCSFAQEKFSEPARPISVAESPLYPELDVKQGNQGTVRLKFKVLKDGSVNSIEVIRSSGVPSLDAAAVKTSLGMRWSPAKSEDGQPVESIVEWPIIFRLEDGKYVAPKRRGFVDTPEAISVQPGSEALAAQLLELSGVSAIFSQEIVNGYLKTFTGTGTDAKAKEIDCFTTKVSPQTTKQFLASIYAAEFGDSELQSAITFFESEIGKKYAQHLRTKFSESRSISYQDMSPKLTSNDDAAIKEFLESRIGKGMATTIPPSYLITMLIYPQFDSFRSQCKNQPIKEGSRHSDERDVLRQARVFHILFDARLPAEEKSKELKVFSPNQRLEKFKSLAKRFSIDSASAPRGGDIGVINQDGFKDLFDRSITDFKANEISDAFQSQFGWHIVYLDNVIDHPIANICRDSLTKSISNAPSNVKTNLQFSAQPVNIGRLHTDILKLIGDSWGNPMQDGDGNLVFFRVSKRNDFFDVVQHTEYINAKYFPEKNACARSSRVVSEVRCTGRTYRLKSLEEYEGRGAIGAVLKAIEFSPALLPQSSSIGSLSGQIVDLACRR